MFALPGFCLVLLGGGVGGAGRGGGEGAGGLAEGGEEPGRQPLNAPCAGHCDDWLCCWELRSAGVLVESSK